MDKGKGKETETEEEEAGFSPLATLPFELLLQVVRNVALTDVASFARLAQVCKAFAYLVITEQSIWRAVCEKTFSRMLWDWGVTLNGDPIEKPLLLEGPDREVLRDGEYENEDEEQEKREIPIDEEEALKYGSNWRKMFMIRPRVRFNGIYISTCNYVRAGASQSWNTPVHIVTYYRYLRFYPNGTVLSLLSTCQPAEVVHGFNKMSLTPAHLGGLPVGAMSWGKYVSKGRWRMDKNGQLDVETEAPMMDKYLFRMALKVKSIRVGGRIGGVNKLVWEGFWSWNIISDDLAEFSLRNDKPFLFSRVGSIEREIGYS
jgi:F-box protein 9